MSDKEEIEKLKERMQQYEKELYDYKQMLDISKSLCAVIEYGKLTEAIVYSCMCQLRVLGVKMFVLNSFDSEVFTITDPVSDDASKNTIPISHPVIYFLNKKNKAYTLAQLKAEKVDIPSQIINLNPSLIVPVKQKNNLNGILLLQERIDLGEGVEYSDYDKEMALNIAALSAIAINNTTLVEMTTTDIMTHLKLKHYFYNVLSEKLEYSATNKLPLCVMMMDIDFFKKINDTYGHACGDFVLQTVAKTISNGIRGEDLAARYGGEEFVVMLSNTDIEAARMIAERIRKNIEGNILEYDGSTMNVTISIGVSCFDPNNDKLTPKVLVEMADQALYISKRNGRNRVTLADPDILSNNEEE